jgi:hypothetical protein
MRTAIRLGILLAISVLSVVGDLLYRNAVAAASQYLDFRPLIMVRTIVFVAFYLETSIFTLNLLVPNERNLFFRSPSFLLASC